MKHRLLAVLLLIGLPAPLCSQQSGNVSDLMTRAVRAYQDLDFDAAATLLRRVLASTPSDSTRARALTYLGAAEHYRGRADSAEAAFRRLIVLAPGQHPDTVVFPPEITRLYANVQSRTKVVTVVTRADTPAAPARVPPPAVATALPRAPAAQPTAPIPTRAAGITVTAAGALVNVRAQSSGGLPGASGMAPGISASARYRRFELGVRYLQGSLGTRDLVEGAAALRFDATPWLTLHAGPQIRRYDMPAGAERWVTWQLGARAEAPVLTNVRAHALLWRGLGLSVNVPPGSGTAKGGEFGVTVDAGERPFWFGLAFAIDRASLDGGGRRETVEALTLSAGLRRR